MTPAQAIAALKDGRLKLVPVEPSHEHGLVGHYEALRPSVAAMPNYDRSVAIYRAMVAAAPDQSAIRELIALAERGERMREALALHVAYEAMPADRGGKYGPKGKAWAAFIEARDAALKDTTPCL